MRSLVLILVASFTVSAHAASWTPAMVESCASKMSSGVNSVADLSYVCTNPMTEGIRSEFIAIEYTMRHEGTQYVMICSNSWGAYYSNQNNDTVFAADLLKLIGESIPREVDAQYATISDINKDYLKEAVCTDAKGKVVEKR